MEFIALTVKV
jgi:hypothetical protein